MPQGSKTFTDWYPEVLEHACRCPLENYTPERAARDAIAMQTSSSRLRKKALTDGPSFEELIKLGCTLGSTDKQAAVMSHTEVLDRSKKINSSYPRRKIFVTAVDMIRKKPIARGLSSKRQAMCGLQKDRPFCLIEIM